MHWREELHHYPGTINLNLKGVIGWEMAHLKNTGIGDSSSSPKWSVGTVNIHPPPHSPCLEQQLSLGH